MMLLFVFLSFFLSFFHFLSPIFRIEEKEVERKNSNEKRTRKQDRR